MPDILYEANMLGTWTDITDDIRTAASTDITRGLASWAPTADPSKVVFRLNNRHGNYSRHNPLSPYYRQLSRYTKIRVSVPSPTSHLEIYDTTGTVSTPHSAAVEMAGDFEVRVAIDVDLADSTHNQAIIGKWADNDPSEQQWLLHMYDGDVYFRVRDAAGVDRAVFTSLARFGGKILRATYNVDDGTGSWGMQFWQSDEWDGPWLPVTSEGGLSGVVGLQATTSSPLRIGVTDVSSVPDRLPFIGYGYRFQLRRGIKGPVVADLDFANVAAGATSFDDSQGNPWTLSGGAQVVARSYRFHGEVAQWPATSDTSDTDSYVTVTAQSRMRRDAKGDPLKSILAGRIPGYSPRAYWPCEDGSDATRVYSPLDGVSPMSVANMDMAQESSMPSSDPLPTVNTQNGAVTARMNGPVPSGSTSTAWSVYFLYRLNTQPSSYASYMSVQGTGTVRDWRLQVSNAGSRILGYDEDGVAVVSHTIATGSDLFNQWILVRFYAEQNGGDVDFGIVWRDIGGDAGAYSNSYAGTLGRVSSVGSPPHGWNSLVDGLALGHISVWDAIVTPAYQASETAGDPLLGYAGEYPADRLHRLSHEKQIPLTRRTKLLSGQRLGTQPKATFLEAIQDAAEVDGGILLDQRNRASYLYLAPSWLENRQPAIVLDYTAAGHVRGEFRPVEDDQYIENDATVTRSGGSSGRYEKTTGSLNVNDPETDEDGIGRVAKQTPLNLYEDEQAEQLASWRVHLGTWDEPRFPRLTVDARAILATVPGIVSIDVGDVIKVTNVPTKYSYDDVYLQVLGYTERLTLNEWEITFNCVPYGPWDTAISGTSRVEATEYSTLADPATSTATSLSVSSTAALWATSAAFPDDFPFDVLVDGERMTVTAISGTSDPQTFTVVRSVNGVVKAQPEGARVQLFTPSHVALST